MALSPKRFALVALLLTLAMLPLVAARGPGVAGGPGTGSFDYLSFSHSCRTFATFTFVVNLNDMSGNIDGVSADATCRFPNLGFAANKCSIDTAGLITCANGAGVAKDFSRPGSLQYNFYGGGFGSTLVGSYIGP